MPKSRRRSTRCCVDAPDDSESARSASGRSHPLEGLTRCLIRPGQRPMGSVQLDELRSGIAPEEPTSHGAPRIDQRCRRAFVRRTRQGQEQHQAQRETGAKCQGRIIGSIRVVHGPRLHGGAPLQNQHSPAKTGSTAILPGNRRCTSLPNQTAQPSARSGTQLGRPAGRPHRRGSPTRHRSITLDRMLHEREVGAVTSGCLRRARRIVRGRTGARRGRRRGWRARQPENQHHSEGEPRAVGERGKIGGGVEMWVAHASTYPAD